MKKSVCFLSLLLLLSFSLVAQESRVILNYETALKIQKGCIEYAVENNVNMAIAIYDVHANLISFIRMDDATVGVSEIAKSKGLSAASYLSPTSETAKWNIDTAPNISTAEGGLPIYTKDGKPLGGIGVSGAASTVDVKCAEAGIKAAGLSQVILKN